MTANSPANGLVRAFEMQAGLLNALGDALGRQRHAIALGNPDAFDEWTEGIRRMTGEIGRVEAHRKELLEETTGTAQPSPADVESRLDGRIRPAFAAARRLLADAARRAARELDVNRSVLAGAIRAREGRIRSLDPAMTAASGYGGAGTSTYGGAAPGTPSALLFNRTA
jgi:hypothetical protein